jgi:putative membrane protein
MSGDPVRREHVALAIAVGVLFVALGIAPKTDRGTWAGEVAPVAIALPLLAWTYRRFRFTDLAYRLMALHAVVLIVGGHYSYAEVPLGHWVRDALDLSRNHYDRLGHFMQGFVPAIVARELLVRTSPLRPGGWLFALVSLAVLGISALYEIIEWWSAVLLAGGAVAFLGTQGDVWDAQWDMFLALCGAVTAQLVLGAAHDRGLAARSFKPAVRS